MKISNQEILLMNALQAFSGVTAKDCIVHGNSITFLVKDIELGTVIGRKGETINKLREKLKKNIEVYGYTKDPRNFVQNSLNKIKINSAEVKQLDGKKIIQINLDSENKRKIFSETNKLKKIKELMERNYGISEIKIK
ncbi:MAG: NusA-like transcription termination signal-binding factor [Candidatus Diapherotrites archaeon]